MALSVVSSSSNSGATNEECLAALREYQSQKRKVDEENGVLRSIIKRAKGIGVPVKAMIQTAAVQKLDPDEVKANLRDLVRMMSLTRMPVVQEDLFPASSDTHVTQKALLEDDLWSAQDAGYRAGRNGVPIDENPYQPGSEPFVGWQTWWHNGQAAIARQMGEKAGQASAARARPARKGGRVAGRKSAGVAA